MNELLKWISVSDRITKTYLDREFQEFGINSSQHMFIKKICLKEGISQEALYQSVYVNKSNITRGLVQLEQKGFIRRIQNPSDKRSMQLYPTEKAREVNQKIQAIEAEWIAMLTAELTAEEKVQLEGLMKKVALTEVKHLDLNKN